MIRLVGMGEAYKGEKKGKMETVKERGRCSTVMALRRKRRKKVEGIAVYTCPRLYKEMK
ncbi:hypothetical protein AJ85_03460 [Alkalihalobacillus alcalophilus ATCC 27647 = CGMCC 1.3604]|uniref:Uncharacterized protein n=1 Tax=Alkalihalobacillus alcalophilus ATCC 27647 = CGMCC 1.3604 TaxID=1218173 RepID=A0A4S4JW28_ALKAL|nr:hypothetical protein [Alkalihalobacillus alcalophilus]THG88447.1 hypothetical protein AJ85_03460 [Alkalihalobacillus alcalophilus ATCC 27647 = CGMCC 1.3604]